MFGNGWLPNIATIINQCFKLLIIVLIKLKIKPHSGKLIPVAFRSGEFQGTFRYQFRNARIPAESGITGMAILAESPANFDSSGIHWNPPE